jgi:SAM-dependent methyltransferase
VDDRAASIVDVCAGNDPEGGPAARRLVAEVLLRRSWALHRHVHLVRAFEEAHRAQPIERALSVGCGAGLSELFLAARHPAIRFHLTDLDPTRLDIGRQRARDLDLRNVSFGSLDLLEQAEPNRYDWVSSIEVLEHIEDDGCATANLLAHSSCWFWLLVPQVTAADLVDPARIAKAWDVLGHHRPGYTRDSLIATLGPNVGIEWMRTCYRRRSGPLLRNRLRDASDAEIARDRDELVALACVDLDGADDGPGAAVEVLGRVASTG